MRVAIVTGHRWSGKSTLASALAARGAAWIHLDPIANAIAAAHGSSDFRGRAADFEVAFAAALPETPPAALGRDGALDGDVVAVAAAFQSAALRRYGRPAAMGLFCFRLPEPELRQRHAAMRDQMFRAGGEDALRDHALERFVLHHPRNADAFAPIVDGAPVEAFLFPGDARPQPSLTLTPAWYHSFDWPELVTRGVADSPAKWTLLAPHLPDLAGIAVLDIGCNQGYFSLRLAERGAEVTGIDVDPLAVVTAGLVRDRVLPPEAAARVRFEVFDLRDLRRRPTVDVTACLSVLHHVPLAQTIADIAALTRRTAFIEALVDPALPADAPLLALSDNPHVQEPLPSPHAFRRLLERHFAAVRIVNPGAERLLAVCDRT